MDRRLFTVMLHEVEKRANEVYALRKDVGFTGEQMGCHVHQVNLVPWILQTTVYAAHSNDFPAAWRRA